MPFVSKPVLVNNKIYLDGGIADSIPIDKILELEKNGKIFVIRPSKLINIKRVEKDSDKIQAMYDLGRNDTLNLMDKISDYISNATIG